jgi:hypothetical protein
VPHDIDTGVEQLADNNQPVMFTSIAVAAAANIAASQLGA